MLFSYRLKLRILKPDRSAESRFSSDKPRMSFAFCLRADGTIFDAITNAMCVDWITAMHPTSPPVPGVWAQVPSNLLPEGAVVCYFNANDFMERVVAPSFATRRASTNPAADFESIPDTRPLITPQWREENPAEWERLWSAQYATSRLTLLHGMAP